MSLRRRVVIVTVLAAVVFAVVFPLLLWGNLLALTALWVVLMLGMAYSSHKAQQAAHQAGQWQERAYVLMSMAEASERGMSVTEWLDGYVERNVMEAVSQGLGKPARDD